MSHSLTYWSWWVTSTTIFPSLQRWPLIHLMYMHTCTDQGELPLFWMKWMPVKDVSADCSIYSTQRIIKQVYVSITVHSPVYVIAYIQMRHARVWTLNLQLCMLYLARFTLAFCPPLRATPLSPTRDWSPLGNEFMSCMYKMLCVHALCQVSGQFGSMHHVLCVHIHVPALIAW